MSVFHEIVTCGKCGKRHNVAKCPQCHKRVWFLQPRMSEQRCPHTQCRKVLHKDGHLLCDGQFQGGKCGNLVPVPTLGHPFWQRLFPCDHLVPLVGFIVLLACIAGLTAHVIIPTPRWEARLALHAEIVSLKTDRNALAVQAALRAARPFIAREDYGALKYRNEAHQDAVGILERLLDAMREQEERMSSEAEQADEMSDSLPSWNMQSPLHSPDPLIQDLLWRIRELQACDSFPAGWQPGDNPSIVSQEEVSRLRKRFESEVKPAFFEAMRALLAYRPPPVPRCALPSEAE